MLEMTLFHKFSLKIKWILTVNSTIKIMIVHSNSQIIKIGMKGTKTIRSDEVIHTRIRIHSPPITFKEQPI